MSNTNTHLKDAQGKFSHGNGDFTKNEKTIGPNDKGYIPLGNVPEQFGIKTEWIHLWNEVEDWFGDIKKVETGKQFLLRMQQTYNIEAIPNPPEKPKSHR